MLRKKKLSVLAFAFLLLGCVKSSYFVADPFWEEATGVSFNRVRFMGLWLGSFVRIIGTGPQDVWFTEEEPAGAVLLPRIEGLLDAGHKVILSPYWLRDLEKDNIQSPNGQLVLLDATFPQVQSVFSNIEEGFYKLGQAAGAYVQKKPERSQALAIFYRGTRYDQFYKAFSEGYQTSNINIDSLTPMRYYAAEINDINIALESIDVANSVIIIAMAHLSDLLYRSLSNQKESLLIVENYGSADDLDGNILLSLDTDYRQLLQKALSLKPNGPNISKVPYLLYLPNPALLSDVPAFEELAQQRFEQQRREYNRLDRRISRWWERALNFFANTFF